MPCRECLTKRLRGGTELYTNTDERFGTFTFNVTMAKYLIASNEKGYRRTWTCSDFNTDCMTVAAINQVTEEHLDHVDDNEPGIMACLLIGKDVVWIPIDGAHRLAKAIKNGRGYAFRFYALDANDSRLCLISHDPDNKTGIKGLNI